MSECAGVMIDTSVLGDDAEHRITDEVGTGLDGSITAAFVCTLDKYRTIIDLEMTLIA
jgi:hypothetical protein